MGTGRFRIEDRKTEGSEQRRQQVSTLEQIKSTQRPAGLRTHGCSPGTAPKHPPSHKVPFKSPTFGVHSSQAASFPKYARSISSAIPCGDPVRHHPCAYRSKLLSPSRSQILHNARRSPPPDYERPTPQRISKTDHEVVYVLDDTGYPQRHDSPPLSQCHPVAAREHRGALPPKRQRRGLETHDKDSRRRPASAPA